LNDQVGLSQEYYNLCAIYVLRKDFRKAITFGNEALTLSRALGYPQNIRNSAQSLVSAYKGLGMYPQAFEMLNLYKRMNDSINNRELRKNLIRRQLQFDYDRKTLADSIRNLAERQVVAERLRKEKTRRMALWGGLLLTIVFGGIMDNRFLLTRRQKVQISREKQRSDELLLNILPEEVAEELKAKGSADARLFDDVTVMCTDFKDFTKISDRLSPTELVQEIHTCFKAFDQIISKHNIEKIKTIGDAYMCAGGLPIANKTNAMDVVNTALEIQKFMAGLSSERKAAGTEVFEIRIGIHTGPVVAGIVGVKTFAYGIWGDTGNIASRMESSGEVGKVNISESTYALVKHRFKCIHRGMIEAKHKGQINMYFVEEEIKGA
jgi:class 3 adenylate cyclase